jgi:hypothetical protein
MKVDVLKASMPDISGLNEGEILEKTGLES